MTFAKPLPSASVFSPAVMLSKLSTASSEHEVARVARQAIGEVQNDPVKAKALVDELEKLASSKNGVVLARFLAQVEVATPLKAAIASSKTLSKLDLKTKCTPELLKLASSSWNGMSTKAKSALEDEMQALDSKADAPKDRKDEGPNLGRKWAGGFNAANPPSATPAAAHLKSQALVEVPMAYSERDKGVVDIAPKRESIGFTHLMADCASYVMLGNRDPLSGIYKTRRMIHAQGGMISDQQMKDLLKDAPADTRFLIVGGTSHKEKNPFLGEHLLSEAERLNLPLPKSPPIELDVSKSGSLAVYPDGTHSECTKDKPQDVEKHLKS